jgi:hypothetical protein
MRSLPVLMIALLIPSAGLAKGECREDKHKFCKDMDKTELRACLKEHEAELSEACKASREAKAKAKQAQEKTGGEPMGKEQGTEQGGSQPEHDTSKTDQSEPQNAPSNQP